MGQLENMRLFVKVAELGSITKTADNLSMAKSAVSRRLNELEQAIGVQLIQRTTRKSHLTEAGHIYLNKCKLVLAEVDEIHDNLTNEQRQLTGTLKIAVPLSFGLSHLVPVIDDFLKVHDQLTLEVDFADRKVDIIEEGFDLAFRIGYLQDSSLKARKITQINHIMCASPEYLKTQGTPKTPEDLKHHKLLKYKDHASNSLTLIDKEKVTHHINLSSQVIANNGDFLKMMSMSGHGITYGPTFITYQEINQGTLVPILPDYQLPTMTAYALFANSQFMPRKVRLLIDYLVERFGETPYWDKVKQAT